MTDRCATRVETSVVHDMREQLTDGHAAAIHTSLVHVQHPAGRASGHGSLRSISGDTTALTCAQPRLNIRWSICCTLSRMPRTGARSAASPVLPVVALGRDDDGSLSP